MSLDGLNLIKKYDARCILNSVSISIAPGECVGVLGDNGSGKSTLMSILAGMQPQSGGTVTLEGAPITKSSRRHMGYVPQTPILVEDLTVRDNLALWQSIYHLDPKLGVLDGVPDCLELGPMLLKQVSTLSGGMKKKVSIAIALMHQPQYLILDEAFAALDAKTVTAMVTHLRQSQMGIVYSSHNISEIAALCHRVVVLHRGEVAHQSPPIPHFDQEAIDSLYRYF